MSNNISSSIYGGMPGLELPLSGPGPNGHLDDVAKRRGESSIASARQECETKRRGLADQILDGAIKKARQSFQDSSLNEALAVLRQAERAKPYAGSSLQSEFERIRKEWEGATKQERSSKKSARKRGLSYASGAALLADALATGVLLRTHREAPAQKAKTVTPVLVAKHTYMEINASPWAKILRVQDSSGKDVVTPAQIGRLRCGWRALLSTSIRWISLVPEGASKPLIAACRQRNMYARRGWEQSIFNGCWMEASNEDLFECRAVVDRGSTVGSTAATAIFSKP